MGCDRVVADGQEAGPGQAEVVEGDASDAKDIARAMENVDAAWYLLHSMGDSGGLRGGREVHGGHLRHGPHTTRASTGSSTPGGCTAATLPPKTSRITCVPAWKSAVLMDSGCLDRGTANRCGDRDGSSSFTMIRHLSERLPGAIAPKWGA